MDMAWTGTEALSGPRDSHTATLLNDGRVLIAGGRDENGLLHGCELYDAAFHEWGSTDSLALARSGHSATLLLDGRVLVAGGDGETGELRDCELFDPTAGLSGKFGPTGSLRDARSAHTATLLSSGTVLVCGGENSEGGGGRRIELPLQNYSIRPRENGHRPAT